MSRKKLFVVRIVCSMLVIAVLLKKFSQRAIVYSRSNPLQAHVPHFAQFKEVRLEEADATRYRLSVEMMDDIKMRAGDRLCIELHLDTDIVFVTGYSCPSVPALPSGWVGAIEYSPYSSGEVLLKKFPCSYKGAVMSALIEKKYIGDMPYAWRQLFIADAWFSKSGTKLPMSHGSSKDSIVYNSAGVSYGLGLPIDKGYDADKPTYLPAAVKVGS